jgi:hypothetical protein
MQPELEQNEPERWTPDSTSNITLAEPEKYFHFTIVAVLCY